MKKGEFLIEAFGVTLSAQRESESLACQQRGCWDMVFLMMFIKFLLVEGKIRMLKHLNLLNFDESIISMI